MKEPIGGERAGAQQSSILILELIYRYIYMSIRKWPTIWMPCIREYVCATRTSYVYVQPYIYCLICNTFTVVIGIGFYCYSYYCRSKLGGNSSKWNNRIKEIKKKTTTKTQTAHKIIQKSGERGQITIGRICLYQ